MLCPGAGRRLLLLRCCFCSWVNHSLASLAHAWAGWRCCWGWPGDLSPLGPRGQCVALPPSQVPLGNAALAFFLSLSSAAGCGRAVLGCRTDPDAWAWMGKGLPGCPAQREPFPFPLSLGQGRAILSDPVLASTRRLCSSFFLAMRFRWNQKKLCYVTEP